MPGAREFMQSSTCHKKFFSFLIWRSYCQHVASGIQGYNTSFNPTRRALDRADNEFELIGPKASFHGSAIKLEDAPKLKLPEVAFIGRTSVGKSSLINAILNRKKFVKTSKKPGHTRLVNFFNINSKMYLVDLPGYGYVEGLGSKRGTEHFVKVAETYLRERAGKELRSVCLLIDGKVGVKKSDLIAFEMMGEFGGPFQVILTKMDKLPKPRHQAVIEEVYKIKEKFSLDNCFPHVFAVSSTEKTGLSELRYFISLNVGLKNSENW
ncbi:probable GTP-binding protein EngB [Pocillopora verrucosa]|uniref:probable GTP-binding protein EngB n=1 Tax=Pocillopora verrucosa TaxID=203993 RepID=UPI002797AF3B|nr:probable GTP-binding protein EngB [Pocillopora verrucosa]